MKAPLCHACGHPLAPWRLIERVAVDKGHVKDARRMVCVPCRRVYRVTITTWCDGQIENQPSHAEWHRLATIDPPADTAGDDTQAVPVDQAIDAAVSMLGTLVDLDRLDLARRAAGLWPGLTVRNYHGLANAMGAPIWQATKALRDAAAVGLVDLEVYPRQSKIAAGRFPCHDCDAIYPTRQGLASHQMTHQPETCDWCGKETNARGIGPHRRHCPQRPSDAS